MLWILRKKWPILLIGCLLLWTSIFGCGASSPSGTKGKATEQKVDTKGAVQLQEIFVGIAKEVKGAVVNISTESTASFSPFEWFGQNPFFNDDFFKHFFSFPRQGYKQKSLGSGVIVDGKGYILTNYHVVKNAEKIVVILSDGRKFDGKIKGTDPKTDLAVLHIDVDDSLPVVKLGDSNKIEVGEWVIAVGNPFGLDHTVTVGVISATGRHGLGLAEYENFIQTDASINPGNSGGPLINLKGEVIGINTAIVASGQGIGFAIPINIANNVLSDLIKEGRVTSRGWLGVYIQDITDELKVYFNLHSTEGALVTEIMKDSPAQKAGFQRDDIIVEFDNKHVKSSTDLRMIVSSTKPGTKADCKIIRDGKEISLTVNVGRLPSEEGMTAQKGGKGETPSEEDIKFLGLNIQDLTPELAQSLGVREKEGVVVTHVEPNSPAGNAGINSGDVIKEINRKKITNTKAFSMAISPLKNSPSILLLIEREERLQYVVINLSK